MLAGVLDGADFAFNTAVAEPTGNDDAVDALEYVFHRNGRVFQRFRINPMDIDLGLVGDAGMVQGFGDAQIGVVKGDVLADEGDVQFVFRVVNIVYHLLPVFHVARFVRQIQFFQYDAVHAFFRQEQRHFVNAVQRLVFNHGFLVDVAEQGQLFLHIVRQGAFRTADDDVRLNADAAQFLDAVLGRLGLQFAGCADIRDEGDVDVQHVVAADFLLDLADSFQEGQAFDIADGAADFRNDDVGVVVVAYAVHALFDFIGNMRDNLNGMAQIIAAPFFLQDGPVNLAGRNVGVLA